jgi:hypothetical protein
MIKQRMSRKERQLQTREFRVPLPRWELPKQRGRPSTAMFQLAQQWAH